MKELNLTVGSKKWSIQLGDCEILEINQGHIFPIICQDKHGNTSDYKLNGNFDNDDFHQSLFESNPFENISTLESVSQPESNAKLINAYCFVIATNETLLESKNIANRKLKKLLESL